MKTEIELQTRPYYEASVRQEIKQIRRQRGKEAAFQMLMFTLFVAAIGGAYVGFTTGAFDNVDVIGACHWINDTVMALGNNVNDAIQNYTAKG